MNTMNTENTQPENNAWNTGCYSDPIIEGNRLVIQKQAMKSRDDVRGILTVDRVDTSKRVLMDVGGQKMWLNVRDLQALQHQFGQLIETFKQEARDEQDRQANMSPPPLKA